MILQGSLRMEYNNESFNLIVKAILKNGIYYFFVSDKEKEKSLLVGQTLELTYIDSFDSTVREGRINYKNIPVGIVKAIENMLLENKKLWLY
ncbi:MAG: hypothetical protein ABI760_10530 [Ferruginibacter sp.]